MQALFGYDVDLPSSRPETRYDRVLVDARRPRRAGRDTGRARPGARPRVRDDGPALVNVLTDPADAYPRSSNLA